MRAALVALALLGSCVLGSVQLTAMAFYGDLAQAPAVPGLVPPALGLRLARPLAAAWMPAAVRVAYARALLHRGDTRAAAALVAGLPERGDSADIRGQLAQDAGQLPAALAEYVHAGDFERAQRLIETDVDARRFAAGAQLETILANALRGNGQAAVRARALWRLGQITQMQAASGGVPRIGLERAALDYYEQALVLAPNEETYLLAAGRQALTLGDRTAAARFYTRAVEAVPASSDARAGLARSQP